MRIKGWNRRVETTSIVNVEETGAVGTDEGTADTVNGVNDVLLDLSAFVILLREAGTHDNEASATFLLGQHIDRLGTEFGCNTEDCTIHLWQIIDFGVAFYALNFRLFRVNGVNLSFEGALHQVLQRFAARFVNIT